MNVECYFCSGPLNPHDLGTQVQIIGWVHGKKKDGMRLREQTGRYAHDSCVTKAMSQPTDQPPLPMLPEDTVRLETPSQVFNMPSVDELETFFEKE